MTKLLDKAIDAVRTLSPDKQDDVARLMLEWKKLSEDDGEEIDPAHLEAIDRGLEDLKHGRIATRDEIEAAFRTFKK